ncbi:hypothetical protein EV182_000397 [Spiromyces aspiralis]|uniref:Uncharacterized protein n=1 Tax=Spiromyces aspiralis TaxID=68401 RepID=A0ACC1HV83_9FUNG|nr:hypothetical protein EV182_000397 [Spiromyces aspiralis]
MLHRHIDNVDSKRRKRRRRRTEREDGSQQTPFRRSTGYAATISSANHSNNRDKIDLCLRCVRSGAEGPPSGDEFLYCAAFAFAIVEAKTGGRVHELVHEHQLPGQQRCQTNGTSDYWESLLYLVCWIGMFGPSGQYNNQGRRDLPISRRSTDNDFAGVQGLSRYAWTVPEASIIHAIVTEFSDDLDGSSLLQGLALEPHECLIFPGIPGCDVNRPTASQIESFHRNGFLIVEEFLTREEVKHLTEEAQTLVNHCYEQGADPSLDWGCVLEPLGCMYFDDQELADPDIRKDKSVFTRLRGALHPCVPDIILHRFGPFVQGLLQPALAGPCKTGVYFENGTIVIEPYYSSPSTSSTRGNDYQQPLNIAEICADITSINWHHQQMADRYPMSRPSVARIASTTPQADGPDSASPLVVCELDNPGSVVFMSGLVQHCSTPNSTDQFRICYMPQFSLGRVRRDCQKEVDSSREEELLAAAIPIECPFQATLPHP